MYRMTTYQMVIAMIQTVCKSDNKKLRYSKKGEKLPTCWKMHAILIRPIAGDQHRSVWLGLMPYNSLCCHICTLNGSATPVHARGIPISRAILFQSDLIMVFNAIRLSRLILMELLQNATRSGGMVLTSPPPVRPINQQTTVD